MESDKQENASKLLADGKIAVATKSELDAVKEDWIGKDAWDEMKNGNAVQLPMPDEWKDPATRPFNSPMEMILYIYRTTGWKLPDIKKTDMPWLINQRSFIYYFLPKQKGVPPSRIRELEAHYKEALKYHNKTDEDVYKELERIMESVWEQEREKSKKSKKVAAKNQE